LGRKLGHSYSPSIHANLGNYEYALYEKEPEELEDFLRNGDWCGLNVTMPYKQAVIPYLDELTPIAQEVGAVNTIVRRNGKLIGANTDYWGFHAMVSESRLDLWGKKCLVLGSGGASKVVQAVLKMYGADIVVISRKGENNYENLGLHKDASVIINTTPVGMYPETGVSPVDLCQFPYLEGVLDVIYNPARTKLLLEAEKRGIVAMNGLFMLVAQARDAANWFTDSIIPDEKITQIHRLLRVQMENIILIGMPGCGKSTIGRLLAEKSGKIFVDADAEIEKLAKKSIPQIFAEDGEDIFRAFETQVLAELGKQSGLVIATGGGCVTRAENYPLLHQNGRILWLQRDLGKLPREGRPLSVDLEAMYRARQPLYASFADFVIDNNGDPNTTVETILEVCL
jgi:shikimate dehydrogenase